MPRSNEVFKALMFENLLSLWVLISADAAIVDRCPQIKKGHQNDVPFFLAELPFNQLDQLSVGDTI